MNFSRSLRSSLKSYCGCEFNVGEEIISSKYYVKYNQLVGIYVLVIETKQKTTANIANILRTLSTIPDVTNSYRSQRSFYLDSYTVNSIQPRRKINQAFLICIYTCQGLGSEHFIIFLLSFDKL